MEGPGPRSHTSSEEDQGQPTPTAPYAKDCQYGPPPARGSSPACRPYVKNCKYGPPPTLGVLPAKNEKAKGTDHPTTTEAQRDRQDWYDWCRDHSPPGKRASKEEGFQQSKQEEDHWSRPRTHPPPGRANSGGASKNKTGDDSRK